jgi:hypothetical protein
MFHDVFDDPGVRKAFEESLGVRAHAFGNEPGHPQWYFERVRYGLRRVELAPLGLYSAVSGNDGQYRDLCSFIEGVGRPKAATVRINVNPLETRADELAKHAESLGFSVVQHQTHMLPIRASIEAMRSNYHSTRRYEALRDTGAQSVIHLASAPSHLEDYFAVYAASLKRWGLQRFIYPTASSGIASPLGPHADIRSWILAVASDASRGASISLVSDTAALMPQQR